MLDEINDIQSFIGDRSEADLMNNKMCQKAIVMSLINIGELSKSFTENHLSLMQEIPWKAIRGFRNIAAHQYGIIEFADVYKTITEDIPLLKAVLLKKQEKAPAESME